MSKFTVSQIFALFLRAFWKGFLSSSNEKAKEAVHKLWIYDVGKLEM